MSMILVTREVSRAVTKCDQDEGKSVFCGGVNLYYQRPMLSTILVFKHATVAWLGPCAITGHSTQTSCLIMLQVCLRNERTCNICFDNARLSTHFHCFCLECVNVCLCWYSQIATLERPIYRVDVYPCHVTKIFRIRKKISLCFRGMGRFLLMAVAEHL